MQKAENGLFVQVDYKGTLASGEIFDTSDGRQPLEVQLGQGQLISGFEKALLGMSLNEKKAFTLEPQDAYGQRDEDLKRSFDRANIPPEMNPEVGQTVAIGTPEGQQIPARILEVDDEKVIVDLNHPLAGESLTFEIELIGISKDPTQSQAGCGGGCACSSDDCQPEAE